VNENSIFKQFLTLKNYLLFTIDPNDKVIPPQAGRTMPQSTSVGIKKNNLISLPVIFDAKRFFDIVISALCLIILSPLFLLVAFIIKVSSKGSVIFAQQRVGKNDKDFTLYKFRTMYRHATRQLSLTIGNNDTRITKIGHLLRRYKFDELPQLYNVFKNDMSIVGPRPELRRYVAFYSITDREI
jgi:lipopolysaccharide/colanic/teichoic acid biosynthesis glycosyltransferase